MERQKEIFNNIVKDLGADDVSIHKDFNVKRFYGGDPEDYNKKVLSKHSIRLGSVEIEDFQDSKLKKAFYTKEVEIYYGSGLSGDKTIDFVGYLHNSQYECDTCYLTFVYDEETGVWIEEDSLNEECVYFLDFSAYNKKKIKNL